VFWFFLRILSKTFHILGRIHSNIFITVHTSLHKALIFFSDFNQTLIFCTDFQKILKDKVSWKSVQYKPTFSMPTGRQTDMSKLKVAFRNYPKAFKNRFLSVSKHKASLLERTVTTEQETNHCLFWVANQSSEHNLLLE
jgi:hypothetical protein